MIWWHHSMASFDGIIGRQHLFAWGSVWSIDMFWVWLTGGAWENLLDTCICSTSTSFTRSTFISVSSMDEKIVWSGNIHMCVFVKSSPSHVESWDKFMVSRRIISLISDVGIEIWWVVADVILRNILVFQISNRLTIFGIFDENWPYLMKCEILK